MSVGVVQVLVGLLVAARVTRLVRKIDAGAEAVRTLAA